MNASPPTPGRQPSGLIMGGKHSLARLETAMWWLETNEAEVFDLIADHALVAFNLARPGVERRLPGIWSQSLLEYPHLACRAIGRRSDYHDFAPAQTGVGLAAPPCSAIGCWRGRKFASTSEAGCATEHSTAEVLSDLLPAGRRDLRFGELLCALGIKRRLLHVLLEEGLLAAVPGTGDRVSKAPLITRASVLEFLTARRM